MIKNIDNSKVPAIYDVTVTVNSAEGGPATISSILFGRKTVAEVYIRQFDINDVSKNEKDASKFLMDVYKDKDALIDNYALTGKFAHGEFPDYECAVLPRRVYSLLNTIFLNFLCVPLVFGQIGVFAFSGSIWQFALALLIVIIMVIGLRKFIGLTKISKGSSYGKKKE